jgi:alpha-1,2-mannosyltransferase
VPVKLVISTAGPARAQTTVPAWLLLPGLGAFLTSLATYALCQRSFPGNGLDLGIYRQAAQAFLAGHQVYDLRFSLGLPFTYPPVTLPLLAPLAGIDEARALQILMALTIAATFLTVWFSTGLMSYGGVAGRLGVAGIVTGLAIWLEPLYTNLDLGQVNALLMLLVVADLASPDRNRFKGIGIGVATACKLVPGIFVVYLLLTRRFRAAAMAVGAFAALTLVAWGLAPNQSNAYWLHALLLDSTRVSAATGPAFVGNQSLRGLALRTFGETAGGTMFWALSALVITVSGLALAVVAHHRREEAIAVVTVAFTALLVSPVSWSHHWVWVAVLLPLLLDVILQMHGRAQVVAAGLLPVWAMMLLVWPLRRRPEDPLNANGIIWVAHRLDQPLHWLGENMYVPATLGTMLLAAIWIRGSGPPRSIGDAVDNPEAAPGGATVATSFRGSRSWTSPIELTELVKARRAHR